jgi:hypothetical protein
MIEGFTEISQGEYGRLKIDDPKNYHSYTARIIHKYFKKKREYPIILDDFDYTISIMEDGRIVIHDKFPERYPYNFAIGGSLELLKEAIQESDKAIQEKKLKKCKP